MSLRKIERYFLGATLFCIPFGTGAMFNGVMSADLIMVQDVFMACMYALWAYRTNLFVRSRLHLGAVGAWALLMALWSLLSMWSAIALQATGIGIYFALKSLLLYFYLVNNLKTRSELFFVVKMLALGLLFQGVLGTMQGTLRRTFGLGFLGELQMSMARLDARVRGTMAYPNRYGAVLILIMPLAISMAIFLKRSIYKWLFVVTSGFALMALFMSLSRSSWAGFGFAMIVMTILLVRRGMLKPKYFMAMTIILVAAIVITFANWDVVQERFRRGSDGSHRATMMNIAYDIIRSNPIVGVGLNNYQWHSFDDFNFWHPVHNEFLRFAAEIGIPGSIMFVVMLFVFLREAYRNILIKDKMINAVAIGCFCGVIAFIVCINIGPEYQHYRIKLTFWALAGITFALRPLRAQEKMMSKPKQKTQLPQRSVPIPHRTTPIDGNGVGRLHGVRRP